MAKPPMQIASDSRLWIFSYAGIIIGVLLGGAYFLFAWVTAEGQPLSTRQTLIPAVATLACGILGTLITLGLGWLAHRRASDM